jgi:hypothetical protein
MYVCDFANHALRKILPPAGPLVIGNPGGAVSTLVHNAADPVPDATYQAAIDADVDNNIYSPKAATAFASCYAHFPFCIRWASTGKLVFLESANYLIRAIDLTAGTIARVARYTSGFAAPPQAANVGPAWQWLDVDTVGACGPVDDIIMVQIGAAGWQRLSLDGTYTGYWANGSAGHLSEASPGILTVYSGGGHYPWALSFAKKSGRMIMNGIGTNTSRPMHIRQPTETDISTSQAFYQGLSLNYGQLIWETGTVVGGIPAVNGSLPNYVGVWPWGIRPSFSNLRGPKCFHHLGCFSTGHNTMDELYSLPDGTPDLEPGDPSNAGTLVAYIQAGMESGVPRPEITGRDMVQLIYFLRRDTSQGSYPTPVAQLPLNPDFTAPVISNVTASHIGNTLTVTWNTNKRTIGFAMAGSALQVPFYNVYSPIESGYGTSHSVTIVGLPSVSPIHYSIVSKDVPGNSSYIADQAIA